MSCGVQIELIFSLAISMFFVAVDTVPDPIIVLVE